MNALAPIDKKPLKPLSLNEASSALAVLFTAYPEFKPANMSEKQKHEHDSLQDARVRTYELGLSELPGWAIERVVKDFISGKAERSEAKRGKLPTVEEIARPARLYVQEEAARQKAEAHRRQQLEESREHERSPEERARMRFKVDVWRTAMAMGVPMRSDASLAEWIALGRRLRIPVPADVLCQVKE